MFFVESPSNLEMRWLFTDQEIMGEMNEALHRKRCNDVLEYYFFLHLISLLEECVLDLWDKFNVTVKRSK